MGIVIVVVLIVAALAIAALIVIGRRRAAADAASSDSAPERDDPTPMTGLASALEQAIDSSGRPMSERLDDETPNVEDLRIPDDTGPLLRRALDHVVPLPDDETPAPESGDTPTS